MAQSTSAKSRAALTAAISRLPAISGTMEHTTLAPAIFARTGDRMSPAAGGSRNTPPARPAARDAAWRPYRRARVRCSCAGSVQDLRDVDELHRNADALGTT